MSSKTVPDLASAFPSVASGEVSWWGPNMGDRFCGFYIGENIVLTAAHALYDVRYTLDTQGVKHWSLVAASGAGPFSKGSVTPWSFAANPAFASLANSDFASNTQLYQDPALSNVDIASMAATSSVATRDLIGAAVFFSMSGTNAAISGSHVTLEYRNNGIYGTASGIVTALGTNSVTTSFHAQQGMSGGGLVSSFRAVDPSHTYVIGVQSNDSTAGADAALLTPTMFYDIMNTLAAGKSGSQAAQPTNYLHGSDNGETIAGTFRPDVVFGNLGDDVIDDGDLNKSYWANDRLAGGPGDDVISAGRGNDLIHGGDWLSATGAQTDLTKDGNDTATYEQLFSSRNGIEIRIDDTNQSSTYSTVAGYNQATFVKDQVSGDVDTLISIETIKGSAGSDIVHIDTLTSARLSGVGGFGGLNNLDFDDRKGSGEVDKLDLSALQVPVVLNLSGSQVTLQGNWLQDNPDPAFTISVNANFLGEHDGTNSSTLSVSGFNYIIGTSSFGTLADGDPATTLSQCDDVLIGSSAPEIFEQTEGMDKIFCGAGDVLFNPRLADLSYSQYLSSGTDTTGWISIIHFNGVEIDAVYEWPSTIAPNNDPTGVHEVGTLTWVPPGSNAYPFTLTPITLYYDASTMTATLTDTRDGSTMTLDNWDPQWSYTGAGPETFDENVALYGSGTNSPTQASPQAKTANEVELRATAQETSGMALAASIAAAGLASMPAHAEFRDAGSPYLDRHSVLPGVPVAQSVAIEASRADHALSNEGEVPFHSEAVAGAAHLSIPLMASEILSSASAADETVRPIAELLQGTSSPGSGLAAAAIATSDAVLAVTADMLQAAMAGVQHAAERPTAAVDATPQGAELGQVLADALSHDSSGRADIDSVLHAIGTGEDHHAQLAQALAPGGPETFGFGHIEDRSLMAMHETIVMHQLAASPA